MPDARGRSPTRSRRLRALSGRSRGDLRARPGLSWIRTAAHRVLGREAERHHREVAVEPVETGWTGLAAEEPGPAEELIACEDDADLAALVEEVSSSLPDRRRDILALYGAGYKRPQIAERLGLPRARRQARHCSRSWTARGPSSPASPAADASHGEPLVLRFVCGSRTPDEVAQAREHLSRCGRCEIVQRAADRLAGEGGRDAAGPRRRRREPGIVERVLHKSAEGLSSLKQHDLDGGAQAKQHVAASYYRAVDPTPLAAARPGTAAAVVASCTRDRRRCGTYCVEQGVDPLGAAEGPDRLLPRGRARTAELRRRSPNRPGRPTRRWNRRKSKNAPAPEPTPTADGARSPNRSRAAAARGQLRTRLARPITSSEGGTGRNL